jgi:hypothetical protein
MKSKEPEPRYHPIVKAIMKLEQALATVGAGSESEDRTTALHLVEVKALFERCSQRIASIEELAASPLDQANAAALSRVVAELDRDLYTLLPEHVRPLKKRLAALGKRLGSLKQRSADEG